jgi:hypothetical protein
MKQNEAEQSLFSFVQHCSALFGFVQPQPNLDSAKVSFVQLCAVLLQTLSAFSASSSQIQLHPNSASALFNFVQPQIQPGIWPNLRRNKAEFGRTKCWDLEFSVMSGGSILPSN